jgi:hypothetical protein
VRHVSVVTAWERLSTRLSAHARAIDLLEPGSRVLPVILTPGLSKEQPEEHFLCWAVVARGAYVPTLFAYPDQQPLRLTLSCPVPVGVDGNVVTIPDEPVRRYYTQVWVYNPEDRPVSLPESWRQLHCAEGLTLWQVPATN